MRRQKSNIIPSRKLQHSCEPGYPFYEGPYGFFVGCNTCFGHPLEMGGCEACEALWLQMKQAPRNFEPFCVHCGGRQTCSCPSYLDLINSKDNQARHWYEFCYNHTTDEIISRPSISATVLPDSNFVTVTTLLCSDWKHAKELAKALTHAYKFGSAKRKQKEKEVAAPPPPPDLSNLNPLQRLQFMGVIK